MIDAQRLRPRYGRSQRLCGRAAALIDVRHTGISPASHHARQRKAAVDTFSTVVLKGWRNQINGLLADVQQHRDVCRTVITVSFEHQVFDDE